MPMEKRNMKDSLFRIGEMAAMNHVSTQTLRLYAKIKLLEPEYLDPETGYRYYTLEQCAKLDLIRALKSCCLPLERIREILELSSEQLLLQALEEQTAALGDEIYRLSVSRSGLLRIQRNLQVLSSLPPLGQVFFEYIPERKIDVQQTGFDFFALGYEGYENMLRHMQNYLYENQLPPSYFINVGTLMKKEHFINGNYISHSAFIFVDELYPETDSSQTLPQGTYMSIVSDDTSLEPEYARKLYQEIVRQDMVPCGDYVCEVLSKFPMDHSGQMTYKIQVPVQRTRQTSRR